LNHAKPWLRNLAGWQPSLNSVNIRAVDQRINLQDWLRKPQPKQVRNCFAIINLGHFTLPLTNVLRVPNLSPAGLRLCSLGNIR
jgi:hypothetical protein